MTNLSPKKGSSFSSYPSPQQYSPSLPRHAVLRRPADPVSKLSAAQLQEMRESFQVLDRDNDGEVTRNDIDDMLHQLGQDASPASLSAFSNINLPTYLNTLSSLLAPLSSREELLAAFSAFDADDSGQIDVFELREALVQAAHDGREDERVVDAALADFTDRRAFAKSMIGMDVGKRGDVFKYHEFVASLHGGFPKTSNGASSTAPAVNRTAQA